MKINKFEDIIAWQKSKELTVKIYQIFRNNRDFSFGDQIKRATVSIGNNIAEGFERKSNSELRHFLFIAKGSCEEVRAMLYVALDLKYISKDDFNKLHDLSTDISKLISGFNKSLNTS